MGWFSKNETQPTQQFGAPTQMNSMGMGMGMGMDPSMMGMQMAQNPMMQQMANDPITATARLLSLYDPMAQFMTTQNMPLMMELIGEIVRLSVKEFFSSVSFKLDEANGLMTLDAASLPASINTMSPENLGLTLTRLQASAQQTLQMNEQQKQMFLQAHTMGGMMNPQQPGFFGSLLGGMLGNQVQQQGGFGQTMAKGATMGAAVL
ncbi:MAG: hypothetical protein CMI60_04325 [Parvibaculum sp.]|nr:hypothetical protein [Parvibaculum sp.]